MRISVVIPAFNEERLLGETLAAIRESMLVFTREGWETELIVCDNNSADRTGELAKAAGATVVFEPVNQISRARNCGAAAATGDWLIFVDADSRPSPQLFREVIGAINSGRYIAGGCTIRMDGDYPLAARAARLWNGISRMLRLMAGSFIFCETTAFRAVGGFSLDLFVAEELDLSQRLKKWARKRGQKLIILHRHPLLTSSRKLQLYRTREHLLFLMKATFSRHRVLTNREACYPWYDGRR